jgi:hypothetical protein
VCLQGASAAEEVLHQLGGKPLKVFVVWEPVLVTDRFTPSAATLGRIWDHRAAQFWDKDRLISHSMGEHDRHSVVWDYIAVYAPGATWGERPPGAVFDGNPVVRVAGRAHAALVQALLGL